MFFGRSWSSWSCSQALNVLYTCARDVLDTLNIMGMLHISQTAVCMVWQ